MSDTKTARKYQHFSIFLLLALAVLVFYIAFMQSTGSGLDFGDDSGALAINGSCEDIRFRGPGMGDMSDETGSLNDATDCSTLFTEGSIFLGSDAAALALTAINFGDDAGTWPVDGECDDPRFEGAGVSFSADSDEIMHDATDCRNLMFQGQIAFTGEPEEYIRDGIDFGDNFGTYANDNECDDTRFTGPGMADESTFEVSNIRHDAADCLALYDEGMVVLQEMQIIDGINFGDDQGSWANDAECDDPRFTGGGTAETLLQEDAMHDASDCRSLYLAGGISYIGNPENRIIETGALEVTDDQIESDKYVDAYSFTGTQNQRVAFDLVSDEFDTYLIVTSPSGEVFENDDFESDTSRSLISMSLPESGTYAIQVTSYSSEAFGSYTLEINAE
tara:strand:+ start:936 stop:2108 length:1173 start_codon:yes stop_codon:yes gene_type:complete